MKSLQFVLHVVMLCLITSVSRAQSFEYVFPYGYSSYIGAVAKSADGKWLMAIHSDSVPGHYYSDTLSLVCLDSTGTLQYKVNVIPPYFDERIEIKELLPLSDGGCLIGYGAANCDVLGYNLSINRYDKEGQLIWAERNMPFSCEDMILTGDEHILVYSGRKIYSVDLADGSLRWSIAVTDRNRSGVFRNDLGELLYQEDSMLFVGRTTAGMEFELLDSVSFIHDFRFVQSLKISPQGALYGYAESSKAILLLDDQLLVDTLLALEKTPTAIYLDEAFLYVIPRHSEVPGINLHLYSTSGNYISTFTSQEERIWGLSVVAHEDQVVISGLMHNGPGDDLEMDIYNIGRSQAWLYVYHFSDIFYPTGSQSVSIVDVTANSKLSVQQSKVGETTVYSFHGGDYDVEVLNTGQDTISSFWVNIAFWYRFAWGICSWSDVKQKHYEDMHVMPGESVLVDFGDIVGVRQQHNPEILCFFTSGPNELPDGSPSDDVFCTNPLFAQPEIQTPFSIQPNPTSGQVIIKMSSIPGAVKWELINVLGQQSEYGWILPGTNEHEVDLDHHVAGLYIIRIGNFIRKVVIE